MTKSAKILKLVPQTNVFAGAPSLPVKQSARQKAKNGISLDGMGEYAALNAVSKAIEALKAKALAKVKAAAAENFRDEGMRTKRRPPNFKARDGIGSASIQLRNNAVGLSEEAVDLCRSYGIEVESETSMADTFVIDEAYSSDPDFIAEMERRFGKQIERMADGRGPVFKKQHGEAQMRVTPAGMEAVFGRSADEIDELLPVVFTLAVRSVVDSADLAPALDIVSDMLSSPLVRKKQKVA